MLALSRARAGSCGLRCIACPSVRRSVLTSSLAMAAALRFAVLICLLCSCAVQPALAPSLSQDRPTERAAREGCATTRDGRGCAAVTFDCAPRPRAMRPRWCCRARVEGQTSGVLKVSQAKPGLLLWRLRQVLRLELVCFGRGRFRCRQDRIESLIQNLDALGDTRKRRYDLAC